MNHNREPEIHLDSPLHEGSPTVPPVPRYGIPPRLMPKRIRFREKIAAGRRVFYGMALLWTAITVLSMMIMLLA